MPKRAAKNNGDDKNKKKCRVLANCNSASIRPIAVLTSSADRDYPRQSKQKNATKEGARTRKAKVNTSNGRFKDTFQEGNQVQYKLPGKNVYVLGSIKSIHNGVDSVLVAVTKDKRRICFNIAIILLSALRTKIESICLCINY